MSAKAGVGAMPHWREWLGHSWLEKRLDLGVAARKAVHPGV